jgi:hypothetical protein
MISANLNMLSLYDAMKQFTITSEKIQSTSRVNVKVLNPLSWLCISYGQRGSLPLIFRAKNVKSQLFVHSQIQASVKFTVLSWFLFLRWLLLDPFLFRLCRCGKFFAFTRLSPFPYYEKELIEFQLGFSQMFVPCNRGRLDRCFFIVTFTIIFTVVIFFTLARQSRAFPK